MVNRSIHLLKINHVFIFAGLASILLSVLIYHQQSIINPDAICYLMSAHEVGITGISGAMNLCGQAKWPFYPVLIFGFAKLSHLSYLNSAYFVDGFFTLLIVLTFILIVRAMGGRGRILWLAAGVILFAHSLNTVREYIIRDHGFWAFYLISLLLLLQYFERPTFDKAFLFSISLGFATLFRIEGLIFLTLIPFLALFYPDHTFKQKLKGLFAFYCLLAFFLIMIWIWRLYHPSEGLEKFGRLAEIPYQVQHGLMMVLKRFQDMQLIIANTVLSKEGERDASLILGLVFISWYLISVFSNLSWAYCLLLFYAIKNKVVSLEAHARFVIYSYLCINVMITFAFLLERQFLSKRYLVALSLILMLPLAFALDHMMFRGRERTMQAKTRIQLYSYRCFIAMLPILMLITIKNDFVGGASKTYIKDAGRFIAEHVPPAASIYINDYQLMYYSAHFGKQIFNEYYRQLMERETILASDFMQYDFLAIRLNKKNQFSNTSLNKLSPLKTFTNKRGDKVMIYQNPFKKQFDSAFINNDSNRRKH
jgi:hypothetical protein